MSLDVFIVRPGVKPPEYFGHLIRIPPVPTAEEVAQAGLARTAEALAGLEDALFADILAGIGRPGRLVPYGLVEPTPWERRFVAWVSGHLGVAPPAGWANQTVETGAPALAEVAAALADPLAPVPPAAAPVRLVATDDLELEALAGARAIRAWLAPQPPELWSSALDDIVVLLPRAGDRRALWRRTFARHGLPVVAPESATLGDEPLGLWIEALARLAGWDGNRRVRRDDLKGALLVPFFSMPPGARRADLRGTIRSLRAHAVTRDQWRAHLAGHFDAAREAARDDDRLTGEERRERLADIDERERGLASLFDLFSRLLPSTDDGLFAGLLRVLRELRATERVRAAEVERAATALERAKRILESLAGEPDPETAPLARLADALASSKVRRDEPVMHGVRITTYSQWDGRPARLAVLSGLEEGGWPSSPARLGPADQELATALGLLTPTGELKRQARIAAAAARSAREGVILTWSRTDDGGTETFAGPLLAALRGTDKRPGVPEGRLTEAEAVARLPADLASPADVLQAPWPEVGAALDDGPAIAWRERHDAAQHALMIDGVRAPERAADVGPYTGEIGVPLGQSPYSPSALEALGQCALRYFLEHVLRLEEQGDAAVDLEPTEVGSLLHDAFCTAAREAIARKGAWDLSGKPEPQRTAHVERIVARVSAALDTAVARVAAGEPTLPEPLVKRVAARWKRALRRWAKAEAEAPEGGLFGGDEPPPPTELSREQLATFDDEDRACIEKCLTSQLEDALALISRARKKAAASAAEAKRWHSEKFEGDRRPLLPKGEFADAARIAGHDARKVALDALETKLRETQAAREGAAKEILRAAWRKDRLAVPRRIVAAEWSFGEEPAPGSDPLSTPKPLFIPLRDGGEIEIRGRVDRVDAPKDRPTLAIVDYKTGLHKSEKALRREVGEGRHLQLPIYALAAERFLGGKGGIGQNSAAVLGRLAFPRTAREATLPEASVAEPLAPTGEDRHVSLEDVVLAHLEHAVRRLESGTLPMIPRACPELPQGGYCSYGRACDFRPDSFERLRDPFPQPMFVEPPGAARDKGPGEPVAPVYPPATPVPPPPTSEEGGARHHEGRELARDLSQDVALAAGAGSGKTTALVDRYVCAVGSGAGPDEILCITFTRKATAEMRSRVRSRLLDDDTKAEPEKLRAAIEALSGAPIYTIDAFAAAVAQDLGGEEIEVAERIRDAADEFVAEELAKAGARPSSDLDRVLDGWPLAKARQVLAALLLQGRALREVGPLDAQHVLAGWDREAERLSPGLDRELKRLAQQAGEVAREADGPSAEVVEPIVQGLAVAAKTLEEHGIMAALFALRKIAFSRKSKDVSDEANALRADVKKLRDAMAWFSRPFEVLKGYDEVREAQAHLDREAALTASANAVARGWLEAFEAARRERGLQTFEEVLERATRALEEADPALAAARFPFRHVLVDEFQDTNAAQVRFIDTLVAKLRAGSPERGCTLFVVGDPKQSIYRFRGAEVELFEERCARGDAALGVLTTCFRAEPGLTRALDRLFARLLAGIGADCAPLDSAATVPWTPLSPHDTGEDGPCIELLLPDAGVAPVPRAGEDAGEPARKDDEEELPPDVPLEQALVRRVRTLLAEARTCPGSDPPIAILTHSWARAVHYGDLLREHGIAAFVQGGRGLLDAREVRDLFHWLITLERQDDDFALAALLRGLTIGISDPGLYSLRRGHGLALRDLAAGGEEQYRPAGRSGSLSRIRHGFRFSARDAIGALEKERGGALPPGVRAALHVDEARLRAFDEAHARANRAFGLLPASEVLDAIIADLGYDAVLRARPDGLQALANLRAFRELVRAAEPGATPGEVVRGIERLAETDDDPAAAGLNLAPGAAVLVTVVHQAKGREWDTVIVPDLERKTLRHRVSGCDLQRLVERRKEGGWARWYLPSSIVEDPSDLFSTMTGAGGSVLVEATLGAERAESRRLLYVACTRARRRLILTARWPDEARFVKWMEAKAGVLSLKVATSWLQDVAFALQLAPGPDGRISPEPGVWVEGRDFSWVSPTGEGFGEAPPAPTGATVVDLAHLAVAARAVETVPLRIVNPSALPPDRGCPAPSLLRPVVPLPAMATPAFASADEEGTAFHRAVQLWGYHGACSDGLVARAVRHEFGEYRLDERVARVSSLLAWQRSAQPRLVAELEAAAARGEVFHEVAVGYLDETGAWIEGSIDLLYRDTRGSWSILDYKTSQVPDDAKLQEKIAEHHGQVAAYAAAARRLLPNGGELASYGLWFVSGGVVARWAAV